MKPAKEKLFIQEVLFHKMLSHVILELDLSRKMASIYFFYKYIMYNCSFMLVF